MSISQLIGGVVATGFAALAGLHVYWAAGGIRGLDVSVPEVDGRPAFVPGRAVTLVIAGLLLTAATLVLAATGLVLLPVVPPWLIVAGTWGVGGVMAMRAIGDFRLVGVFKRIRGTRFADRDSRLYVPLCLLLAIGCVLVTLAR